MVRVLLIALLCAAPLLAQPEMRVLRGDKEIKSGGKDGLTETGPSPFFITYTIGNDGDADLELDAGEPVELSDFNNCNVSLNMAPASTVPADGETTFRLQVSPIAATAFSFRVTAPSNDPDSPYTFQFNGHTDTPDSSSGSSGGGCQAGEGAPAWLLILLFAAITAGRAHRGQPFARQAPPQVR